VGGSRGSLVSQGRGDRGCNEPYDVKRGIHPRGQTTGDDEALRLVIEGTVAETGTGFFRALVRNLSRALGTLGAWVTEYLPEEQRLRSYAMWMGEDFVEHYEYPLAGTACAEVVGNKTLVHIPDRLVELFPQDTDLIPLDAMSYLGMPLLGIEGEVLGHLGVLDNKPMPRDERAIALFQVFAARATGELRRLKAMQQVQAREELLSLLL
jgi:GAF domain-containing protein